MVARRTGDGFSLELGLGGNPLEFQTCFFLGVSFGFFFTRLFGVSLVFWDRLRGFSVLRGEFSVGQALRELQAQLWAKHFEKAQALGAIVDGSESRLEAEAGDRSGSRFPVAFFIC